MRSANDSKRSLTQNASQNAAQRSHGTGCIAPTLTTNNANLHHLPCRDGVPCEALGADDSCQANHETVSTTEAGSL